MPSVPAKKSAKPPASTGAPRLSEDQLGKLLKLVKGSDSVELKLTIPESNRRATAAALGLDPLEAQIRQVFFFDTPDLALNEAGVVVRARRVQGKRNDSVVKLRPVVPDDLSSKLRKSEGFNVEVDAMPGGFVCSATLKRELPMSAVRPTVAGKRPLSKLFSKQQRAFMAEHAPEGVVLDDLSILGPIFVLKLRLSSKQLDRRLVAELWLYPDGSSIFELSTKCQPSEALQVAAETRLFLEGKGVDLSSAQQTKTKAALEFFSREL